MESYARENAKADSVLSLNEFIANTMHSADSDMFDTVKSPDRCGTKPSPDRCDAEPFPDR